MFLQWCISVSAGMKSAFPHRGRGSEMTGGWRGLGVRSRYSFFTRQAALMRRDCMGGRWDRKDDEGVQKNDDNVKERSHRSSSHLKSAQSSDSHRHATPVRICVASLRVLVVAFRLNTDNRFLAIGGRPPTITGSTSLWQRPPA